jgi:hypothetical protein
MVVFQLICEELETVMELTEARVFRFLNKSVKLMILERLISGDFTRRNSSKSQSLDFII